MFLKKNKDKLSWDNEVCNEAEIADIGSQKLKVYIKNCGLKYDAIENSLKKLKLMRGKRLLNAAVIMFGKKPEKFFANAKLRYAVFATNDTTIPVDMQDFEGDLFHLIKQAEEFFIRNIHVGMRLEGFRRVDVPEIDKEAFREAIVNAFCHRDYWAYDSINIAIFKDRVEVRSPGLLFGGLTIARIRSEMVSERRNELVAELFHRAHFIERWGRGIRLILSKEPTAVFKEIGTHFITIFKRKNVSGATPQATPQVVFENLTALEQKIVLLIGKDKYISRADIAGKLRISADTVKEYIKRLRNRNIIRRKGKTTGGYWLVATKF